VTRGKVLFFINARTHCRDDGEMNERAGVRGEVLQGSASRGRGRQKRLVAPGGRRWEPAPIWTGFPGETKGHLRGEKVHLAD